MKRNTISRVLVLGMAMSLALAGTAGAQGNKHGNKKGKKGPVAQAQVQPSHGSHGNGPKVKAAKRGGGPAAVQYHVAKPQHGRAVGVNNPRQHVQAPAVARQQTTVAHLPRGARAVSPQIETRVRSFSGPSYNQVLQGYSRQYRPRTYWTQRYNRFVLVGGGYYYINNGYWYPAWGYDSAYSRYTYDVPVYAYNNLPPDRVLRETQSQLQNLGYYRGSVDGLFGPMTRSALRGFQSDYGLPVTGAADQATLYALGMS